MDNILKNGFKSLITIAKNTATGVDQSVSSEIKETRISECNNCPELMITRQCGQCMCFVDFKTSIKQEKCPLDKWLAVKEEEKIQ